MSRRVAVHLVGAGPGDPDLLTVKAVRALQAAEVVVYDRLVSPEVMALVPSGAARIDVGKQPRRHPVPQQEINAILVRLARAGRRVVRLKGGDPYTFGRGSEEALALAAHGIPYDVVPGITSASACAAAAGFPLTHRGLAAGVRFVTGHCRNDRELDLDWDGLADPDTTLVIYMGRANIRLIASRLMHEGLAADMPVAAICSGTTPRQKVLTATLATAADCTDAADISGPVLFVVGRVVGLRELLTPAIEQAVLAAEAHGALVTA